MPLLTTYYPPLLQLVTYYLVLTAYCVMLTTYYLLLTTYYLLLTTYCLLLTTYYIYLLPADDKQSVLSDIRSEEVQPDVEQKDEIHGEIEPDQQIGGVLRRGRHWDGTAQDGTVGRDGVGFGWDELGLDWFGLGWGGVEQG